MPGTGVEKQLRALTDFMVFETETHRKMLTMVWKVLEGGTGSWDPRAGLGESGQLPGQGPPSRVPRKDSLSSQTGLELQGAPGFCVFVP